MSVLSLAISRPVVMTAVKLALFVGTLLALINHWPAISAGTLTSTNAWQILLCYLVPYAVSTYSSVQAMRREKDTPGS